MHQARQGGMDGCCDMYSFETDADACTLLYMPTDSHTII